MRDWDNYFFSAATNWDYSIAFYANHSYMKFDDFMRVYEEKIPLVKKHKGPLKKAFKKKGDGWVKVKNRDFYEIVQIFDEMQRLKDEEEYPTVDDFPV